MEAAIERKQTSFRFRKDLLERLKVMANKGNRSLNSYVENLLMEVVYHEPNEETFVTYEKNYEIYLELYRQLKDTMKK